jgi:hypothetical protein
MGINMFDVGACHQFYSSMRKSHWGHLKGRLCLWQPYLSVFIIQLVLEATLRLLSGILISTCDPLRSILLNLGALRLLLFLILMIHSYQSCFKFTARFTQMKTMKKGNSFQ